jgi:uncharacterized membrane-anchored protein
LYPSPLLSAIQSPNAVLWKRTLGTVAVETVRSPQAEGFYWATVMFSQTLGTASRDRSQKSARVVPASVVAVTTAQYRSGWKRSARTCASRP